MADQRQNNTSQRGDGEFPSRLAAMAPIAQRSMVPTPAMIPTTAMVPTAMVPTVMVPTAPASMLRARPMLSNHRGGIQNPNIQHGGVIALQNNNINNYADGPGWPAAQPVPPFPRNPYNQALQPQSQLVLYQQPQPERQFDELSHQFERQRQIAPFRPSSMIREEVRVRRENPTPQDIARRVAAGVSANYKGDYTLPRNRPADIPEEQNCSVFITGLPGDVTTHQLLSIIRDTGRVWASVINPPISVQGTAAAKITFFTPAAAQTFLARANGQGQPGFVVRGHQTVVRPDRNRVPAADELEGHTRCLMIAGPRDIVTEAGLAAYFSQRFRFETDEVDFLVRGQVINVVEWRFGSYRCQAQWAWRSIREDAFLQAQGVRVNFERDPCDW
jgi:hypothetical protein